MSSLYWYDYETFGRYPQTDRISQFGGLRTDEALNVIGEPDVFYCRPSVDYLPHPEACLLTGITPQMAAEHGLAEVEFTKKIHQLFSQPGTCVVGYNNIRFDDELTRVLFYRNFLDPYQREYQNGNSRWDLIDIVRLCYALRPDGLVWPLNEDGSPCFKLEALTAANGVSHEQAHDALSDVCATLAIARLIREHQPKLYQYAFEHRHKGHVLPLLNCFSPQPLVHISRQYPAKRGCCAIVVPLLPHPTQKNGVIVYDLSVDPEPLLSLSGDEIRERVFTAAKDLPEGVERIPLKVVHINKCPVVVPLKTLRPQDAERLGISIETCLSHFELFSSAKGLTDKLNAIYRDERYPETDDSDPDIQIYSGGFFSARDRSSMNQVVRSSPKELAEDAFSFQDKRLPEMLFRYRARNFFETLSAEEQQRWYAFCRGRLSGEALPPNGLSLSDYQGVIKTLREETEQDGQAMDILKQLDEYGQLVAETVGLDALIECGG